jgi:ribosome-associated protein
MNTMEEVVSTLKRKRTNREYPHSDSELVNVITKSMEEKKASNIVTMNLSKLDKSICDTFVICNADSGVQVRAITDNVEDEVVKQLSLNVRRRQGDENALWVILDYGSVVVHVFRTETREYYNLENLWADAEIMPMSVGYSATKNQNQRSQNSK